MVFRLPEFGNSRLRSIKQPRAVVDGQYFHACWQHTIDDAVVSAKHFPYIFAPQFGNYLPGLRKTPKPVHGAAQPSNEGRCRCRSILGNERSNFTKVVARLASPDTLESRINNCRIIGGRRAINATVVYFTVLIGIFSL